MKYEKFIGICIFLFVFLLSFWHHFWVFKHQLLQNMNFVSENMKKVLNLVSKYAKIGALHQGGWQVCNYDATA